MPEAPAEPRRSLSQKPGSQASGEPCRRGQTEPTLDKAQALLDGKVADAQPAAADGRIVVQVGAFADAARRRKCARSWSAPA